MRRKLVSPRSIRKIVVLSRPGAALTIHKRRRRAKARRKLQSALAGGAPGPAIGPVRAIAGMVRIARVLGALSKPRRRW